MALQNTGFMPTFPSYLIMLLITHRWTVLVGLGTACRAPFQPAPPCWRSARQRCHGCLFLGATPAPCPGSGITPASGPRPRLAGGACAGTCGVVELLGAVRGRRLAGHGATARWTARLSAASPLLLSGTEPSWRCRWKFAPRARAAGPSGIRQRTLSDRLRHATADPRASKRNAVKRFYSVPGGSLRRQSPRAVAPPLGPV